MAGFFPYRIDSYGGVVPTQKGKAPASTAIAVGDPLTIDSNGYYALMVSGGQCDGVAASSVASGSAGQDLVVWPAWLTFKVATETNAPAQTDVGEFCDFETATTGAFTLDVSDSTNDDFFVEGIVERLPDFKGQTLAAGDEVYGHFNDTCYNA